MYALFEEAGKFHAGRVMHEADTSAQIELDSGKRVKVKAANLLLRFDAPAPTELIASAQTLADEIDLDLAWEFAPEGEFGFADLARDYFDASAGAPEKAAALFRLFGAPHYFRRLGKGNFRKAPEETVKAALLGIERKRQVIAQVDAWAAELVAGTCPPAVREQLYRILFKPDRNAPEYKAVVEAARQSGRSPLDLLKDAGAIDSPYQFHWRRFLFENFPKGTGFADLALPAVSETLARAPVEAFSIDDSATTEIDDALSVQGLGSGRVTLGIHIAAPALAFAPGTALDQVARERLSTVYMPGSKVTMLPADLVAAHALIEGRESPAVSLYVSFDEATLAPLGHETRLELVRVGVNLRHDRLDADITEATLDGRESAGYPFATELAFGFRLARHLKAQRETVRGRPENFNRPDYAFRLLDVAGEPKGSERIEIQPRERGSPIDLIVSEAMILANATWGGWLAECGVPAIYRTQASLAPGNKVRMGTRPAPHAGIGVPQYAWATSPLRRYVDLVNQWQIIACARHGRTAALAAPFKPKDVQLFAIISAFDAAYAEYNAFQSAIERYWTLQYLAQHCVDTVDATVMKDGLVRADELPLVFRAVGAEALGRGQRVRVRIGATDLLTLDVHASVVERLADTTAPAVDEAAEEASEDESGGVAVGGPLQFAIGDSAETSGDQDAAAAPAAA